jgi:hypothetical protein
MNDKAAVDTCFNLLNVKLQRQVHIEHDHEHHEAVDTDATVKAGRVEQKSPAETASNDENKE